MRVFAVVAAVLLSVSCSQELPTSPSRTAQKALLVTEATPAGRVRAVSHPAGCVDLSGFYDVRYEGGQRSRASQTGNRELPRHPFRHTRSDRRSQSDVLLSAVVAVGARRS